MHIHRLFKNIWYKSWTVLWGKILAIPGTVLTLLSYITDQVSNPTVKGYLDTIGIPRWATVSLAVIGIITIVAHGRK